ncbi:MAG: GTPase Era [Alphaproteobacteria bacterium]|nr:GTPase Era [Alphaproteobacteria bacterium]
MDKNDTPQRCGFIALIGAPNAGKSTLINQLVGAKVAIVSPKVQTTRTRVTGIAMHENSQIIFIDTPGIFAPEKRLDRSMVHAAWEGVKDADAVAILVDVSRKNPLGDTQRILDGLKGNTKPVALVLNKIDLIPKDRLIVLAHEFNEAFPFEKIFMIAALNNDGVPDLMQYFIEKIPEGVFLYPEDEITTLPMRLLAAEITREKIFLQLHKELPYSCTVETETFDESNPEKWLIEQTIYVQRESQRAIVLGHKGARIKAIGTAARKDMRDQFEVPVHLQLFVKVRDAWLEDPERYRAMGLEYKV